MIDINIYADMIDLHNFLKNICYISFICWVLVYGITVCQNINQEKYKNMARKKLKPKEHILVTLFVLLFSPFLIGIFKYFYRILFIYYLISIYFFCKICVQPIIQVKQSKKQKNYSFYSLLLIILIFGLSLIDFNDILSKTTSEGSLQVNCIILLLFETHISLYCLILNVCLLIKKFNIDKLYNCVNILQSKITKFSTEENYPTFKSFDIKYFNSIIFIIYNLLSTSFKFLLSLFLTSVVLPLFDIFAFVLEGINHLSKTNTQKIDFKVSKLTFILSIIMVLIIIYIYNCFQERIVSTYEFISSVILIPLIITGLQNIEKNFNN